MKLISLTPWISVAALAMVGCATAQPARTTPTVNVAGDWHGTGRARATTPATASSFWCSHRAGTR